MIGAQQVLRFSLSYIVSIGCFCQGRPMETSGPLTNVRPFLWGGQTIVNKTTNMGVSWNFNILQQCYFLRKWEHFPISILITLCLKMLFFLCFFLLLLSFFLCVFFFWFLKHPQLGKLGNFGGLSPRWSPRLACHAFHAIEAAGLTPGGNMDPKKKCHFLEWTHRGLVWIPHILFGTLMVKHHSFLELDEI